MVDSLSLRLVFRTGAVTEAITQYLSNRLSEQGFTAASSATLNFLSALECGNNYASDIARNLNVSRQMVAKTVKELAIAGYLQQTTGPGRQKHIVFTELGEKLMSNARQLLAELDQVFIKAIGLQQLGLLCKQLEDVKTHIPT